MTAAQRVVEKMHRQSLTSLKNVRSVPLLGFVFCWEDGEQIFVGMSEMGVIDEYLTNRRARLAAIYRRLQEKNQHLRERLGDA